MEDLECTMNAIQSISHQRVNSVESGTNHARTDYQMKSSTDGRKNNQRRKRENLIKKPISDDLNMGFGSNNDNTINNKPDMYFNRPSDYMRTSPIQDQVPLQPVEVSSPIGEPMAMGFSMERQGTGVSDRTQKKRPHLVGKSTKQEV
ncbi:hypothetical protein U1Q18_029700 [Sarracenia purpurea var. burkii]